MSLLSQFLSDIISVADSPRCCPRTAEQFDIQVPFAAHCSASARRAADERPLRAAAIFIAYFDAAVANFQRMAPHVLRG